MTLHVINKCEQSCWEALLSALQPGDALLLIEEGVAAALPQHPLASKLAMALQHASLHALSDDLALRGISGKIRHEVAGASYHDFVAMSVAQQRVVNWR